MELNWCFIKESRQFGQIMVRKEFDSQGTLRINITRYCSIKKQFVSHNIENRSPSWIEETYDWLISEPDNKTIIRLIEQLK